MFIGDCVGVICVFDCCWMFFMEEFGIDFSFEIIEFYFCVLQFGVLLSGVLFLKLCNCFVGWVDEWQCIWVEFEEGCCVMFVGFGGVGKLWFVFEVVYDFVFVVFGG